MIAPTPVSPAYALTFGAVFGGFLLIGFVVVAGLHYLGRTGRRRDR